MFYEHKTITIWRDVCYQEILEKCLIYLVSFSEILLQNTYIEMNSEPVNG